jgi:hypothetical protein
MMSRCASALGSDYVKDGSTRSRLGCRQPGKQGAGERPGIFHCYCSTVSRET